MWLLSCCGFGIACNFWHRRCSFCLHHSTTSWFFQCYLLLLLFARSGCCNSSARNVNIADWCPAAFRVVAGFCCSCVFGRARRKNCVQFAKATASLKRAFQQCFPRAASALLIPSGAGSVSSAISVPRIGVRNSDQFAFGVRPTSSLGAPV